jgi:hypothetical protein
MDLSLSTQRKASKIPSKEHRLIHLVHIYHRQDNVLAATCSVLGNVLCVLAPVASGPVDILRGGLGRDEYRVALTIG